MNIGRVVRSLARAGLLAGLPVACDGTAVRPPGAISIATDSIKVGLADSVQLSAVVLDVDGVPTTARIGWSAADTTILTVDSTGFVRPRRVGGTTIEARVGEVVARRPALVTVRFVQLSGYSDMCGRTAEGPWICWDDSVRTVPGALAFTQVAPGTWFSCGLTALGAVWCWGGFPNPSVHLGDGVTNVSTAPVKVALTEPAVRLFGAHTSACALGASGTVWCWGAGGYFGLFGWSTMRDAALPVAVADLITLAELSLSYEHACGLNVVGEAYCWGNGPDGRLGANPFGDPYCRDEGCMPQARRIAAPLVFRQISAGPFHTCGVTTSGEAWCWGTNSDGQIGRDTTLACLFYGPLDPCTLDPIRVAGNHAWAQVVAGYNATCGITTDGEGWCWGDIGYGAAHEYGLPPDRPEPVSLGPLRWTSLAMSAGRACGLATDQRVYCWGREHLGGGVARSEVPVPVWYQR